ncbi:MAG: hypothetical protein ACREIQ_08325, partial [Nitrospiria bacterium]
MAKHKKPQPVLPFTELSALENRFDKAQRPKWDDTEEWGSNKHGSFSFHSGHFIPKADHRMAPED